MAAATTTVPRWIFFARHPMEARRWSRGRRLWTPGCSLARIATDSRLGQCLPPQRLLRLLDPLLQPQHSVPGRLTIVEHHITFSTFNRLLERNPKKSE